MTILASKAVEVVGDILSPIALLSEPEPSLRGEEGSEERWEMAWDMPAMGLVNSKSNGLEEDRLNAAKREQNRTDDQNRAEQ